jgi:hypothetical protein
MPLPTWVGAVQETSTNVALGTALTPVGEPGALLGVTEFDATEAALVSTALVAVTLKVYGVPLASPITVHLRAVVVVQVFPPGLEVTV